MEIDIRTRPLSQDAQAVVEQGPQPKRQLSPAARTMILGIADSISDPELSASLKRLADRAS